MAGRVHGGDARRDLRDPDIAAGEELSYDYNFAHFGGEGTTSFTCMCGHPMCRGTLDANPERTRNYGRPRRRFKARPRAATTSSSTVDTATRNRAELPQQDGEVPRGVRHRREGARRLEGAGAPRTGGSSPPTTKPFEAEKRKVKRRRRPGEGEGEGQERGGAERQGREDAERNEGGGGRSSARRRERSSANGGPRRRARRARRRRRGRRAEATRARERLARRRRRTIVPPSRWSGDPRRSVQHDKVYGVMIHTRAPPFFNGFLSVFSRRFVFSSERKDTTGLLSASPAVRPGDDDDVPALARGRRLLAQIQAGWRPLHALPLLHQLHPLRLRHRGREATSAYFSLVRSGTSIGVLPEVRPRVPRHRLVGGDDENPGTAGCTWTWRARRRRRRR